MTQHTKHWAVIGLRQRLCFILISTWAECCHIRAASCHSPVIYRKKYIEKQLLIQLDSHQQRIPLYPSPQMECLWGEFGALHNQTINSDSALYERSTLCESTLQYLWMHSTLVSFSRHVAGCPQGAFDVLALRTKIMYRIIFKRRGFHHKAGEWKKMYSSCFNEAPLVAGPRNGQLLDTTNDFQLKV